MATLLAQEQNKPAVGLEQNASSYLDALQAQPLLGELLGRPGFKDTLETARYIQRNCSMDGQQAHSFYSGPSLDDVAEHFRLKL